MSNDIKQINKQLDILQKELIRQLKTTNIEYIDLNTYVNQVNNLKIKKNTLYLNSF